MQSDLQQILIESLQTELSQQQYPDELEKYPWSGHLGIQLVDKVIPIIEEKTSVLLFTNTRAQTEIWYQRIMGKRPDWAGWVAIHHGSLDQSVRTWVEESLHLGKLKLVVCTSSLDLGVDFNIIKKAGSWFSYGDTKLGQGRDAVKQLLMDNPELSEEIEAKLTAVDDEKITLEWQARGPKKIGKGKETVEKKLDLPYESIKEAIVIISF